MGTKAKLTIKFKEEAPFEKRGEFIGSLRKDGWEKSPEAENIWTATFKTDVMDEAAMNVVKHDVDRASKNADILNYESFIELGDGPQNAFGPFYSDEHLSALSNKMQEPDS